MSKKPIIESDIQQHVKETRRANALVRWQEIGLNQNLELNIKSRCNNSGWFAEVFLPDDHEEPSGVGISKDMREAMAIALELAGLM
jgi:hypothetical protein